MFLKPGATVLRLIGAYGVECLHTSRNLVVSLNGKELVNFGFCLLAMTIFCGIPVAIGGKM